MMANSPLNSRVLQRHNYLLLRLPNSLGYFSVVMSKKEGQETTKLTVSAANLPGRVGPDVMKLVTYVS